MILTIIGMKMNRYTRVENISLFVKIAIRPINVRAINADSISKVKLWIVWLKILGVFIL